MFRDQVREVLNQTNPKMFLKRRAFLVELDQDFLFYVFGVLYPRRQIDVVVLAKNRLKVRQTYITLTNSFFVNIAIALS